MPPGSLARRLCRAIISCLRDQSGASAAFVAAALPCLILPALRAVVEEAAALTSIALFLGMIAVWAQVISAL